MTAASEGGTPLHLQVRAMLAQLQPLAAQAPQSQQLAWAEHQDRLEELAQFLELGGAPVERSQPAVMPAQWIQFGMLLRDKRNAAGFSRVQLARRAKLSDATIKFLETARHPPSRATLIRLIGVLELQLSWSEVPGHPTPPMAASIDEAKPRPEDCGFQSRLNCLLAPSYDPLALIAERTRFLQGAGGYLEQTSAYLDPSSAAAYLAMTQNSLLFTELRGRLPLREMAKLTRASCGPVPLQVLALGSGDGVSETLLVEHLLEAGAPRIELCLMDISQPLLACAYRHAAERLGTAPAVHVWGLQGNFHHLPLYTALHVPPPRRPRYLYTMLGGTLAHLEHEPRFLQQSLLDCAPDDLLLLDLPLALAPGHEPTELQRRDHLFRQGVPAPYAAWLEGPLWRHCPLVERVEFHWSLETHCPVPGSYALQAVATVKSSQRADRRFCLFRLGRYDPAQVDRCLSALGWEPLGASLYGGEHSLRLYRKRADVPQEELGAVPTDSPDPNPK